VTPQRAVWRFTQAVQQSGAARDVPGKRIGIAVESLGYDLRQLFIQAHIPLVDCPSLSMAQRQQIDGELRQAPVESAPQQLRSLRLRLQEQFLGSTLLRKSEVALGCRGGQKRKRALQGAWRRGKGGEKILFGIAVTH
jgi:hypothetical protein